MTVTPFGARLRQIRDERGMSLTDMARAVGVSPAYLSALEHGRRGRPSWWLIQRITQHLNIIWDEADELERLADLSHLRVVIDTSGLDAAATAFANLLAERIGTLDADTIAALRRLLDDKR